MVNEGVNTVYSDIDIIFFYPKLPITQRFKHKPKLNVRKVADTKVRANSLIF